MSSECACAAAATGCIHASSGHCTVRRCAFTSATISSTARCPLAPPVTGTATGDDPFDPPLPAGGAGAGTWMVMHPAASAAAAPATIHRIDSLLFRETGQQFHHPQVVRVGGGIVVRDLVVLLRRLQDEGDAAAARVRQQPAERLRADPPVAQQHVAVAVAGERAFAVVQVKEAGLFPHRLLPLVQDLLLPGLRL